jgi:hypothetical protein
MKKLHNLTDETALHPGEGATDVSLLLVERKESLLYSLMQLAQIAPADGIANRDEDLCSHLDQNAFSDRKINGFAFLFLVGQNSRSERGHAVKPVRENAE